MEGCDHTERFILGKYFNLDQGIFLMGEARQMCSNYFGQGLNMSPILSPALPVFICLALDPCQNGYLREPMINLN